MPFPRFFQIRILEIPPVNEYHEVLLGVKGQHFGGNYMSMPGPLELAVIFLVVLLLFGAKRLPEIGRSLGEGIREFKRSIKGSADPKDQQDENK